MVGGDKDKDAVSMKGVGVEGSSIMDNKMGEKAISNKEKNQP